MVWLIQASAWNQTCHSTNDKCEALASPKGCFLCFCFSPSVFFHWTASMHTSGGIRVEVWGKRKRLQDLEPFLWAGTDSNCRSREATDLQSARFNHLPTYPKFWASCRIRTNDPEITNHVLWPTELKRRLLVKAAVACFKRVQRYELFLKHQIISSFFAVFFQKKIHFTPHSPHPPPKNALSRS